MIELVDMGTSTGMAAAISNEALPSGLNVPLPRESSSPLEYAEAVGEAYLSFSAHSHRKSSGHYLTPAAIARFMAGQTCYSKPHMRVLDPGSGTGILSAAVCEAASLDGIVRNLHIDAYEVEHSLAGLTHLVLSFARVWLDHRGIALTFNVTHGDFVLDHAPALRSRAENSFWESNEGPDVEYDLVISNPPYFKIGKDDPRSLAWDSAVHGQPNIYALFMAVSAELLAPSGQLVYIVPRSFASGPYFKRFREVFFRRVTPTVIHLFESRKDVFKNQTVLQENLVIGARLRMDGEALDEGQVLVSHSEAVHDLAESQRLLVDIDSVLDLASANKELSIPLCAEDLELVQAVRAWPKTLHSLGLEVSTGPVVPFRATQFLAHADCERPTAPLLWMQNVHPMRTSWPLPAAQKPQWIEVASDSLKLLVADATYVLLRRFSAKEEKRRLIAAPLIQGALNDDLVGLENHLNYIRGVSRELDQELAYGLSALLNSTFLDRFFRISNGNTQVSATELRAMPLPDEQDIRTIGAEALGRPESSADLAELDTLVAKTLNLSPALHVGLELAAR